jgi:predicted ATPase
VSPCLGSWAFQEGLLDIPIVSSMVKELVTLALFLRYRAVPGDFLVIDEPEMHLHPEAQVALAEFLAMMANSDLRVMITTHSPYIVDHLINLMKAASRTNKDEIKNMFYLKQSVAFIEKKDVAVYLFQNGTAKTILDEEGIIDWRTFSEVSEKLSKLYFEI